MTRIRRRLRRVRAKLARVSGLIAIAERRCRHYAVQFQHAQANAEQLERQGYVTRAKRARGRAQNRRERLRRWRRRKNWLQGKRRYLDAVEKQWVEKKVRWLKDHPQPTTGWRTFDGKPVPAWMVPWLNKSRYAGWQGVVVSGVRTPEYSEQLCYQMCGAPSCSGRCAGRYSNHNCTNQCPYPTGALDVSDYDRFEQVQYEIGSPLRNALPVDPVHFSVSGR